MSRVVLLQTLPQTNSAADVRSVLGSTRPRIQTPPLVTGPPGPCGCGCALDETTSYGFDAAWFAENVVHHPLDPWERLAAIHGGELLPDGTPRFSIVLVLVARQNGKTELLVILSLYWLYIERVPLVLGTSTKLDYAKESWHKVVKLARRVPCLRAEIPVRGGVRETNGEQELLIRYRDENAGEEAPYEECRYKIAASNADGGRSLAVKRLILDELRQHHDYTAWDALEPTISAQPDGQAWCLSNAGSDASIVLNDKRAEALAAIKAGQDTDLCLLEWSAPEDADPLDIHALAQANPNLGRRKDAQKLLASARRAVASGGDALAGFKTESMCIRVKQLNAAIDSATWKASCDPGDLSDARTRVAVCLDVAPDGLHATLAAAASLADGRVRGELVAAWDGPACIDRLRRGLTSLLARVRPQVLGWLPAGPAAALAADLKARPGWPPAGVTVAEIRGEVAAVCMGFAEWVAAGRFAHSDDPLLNAHVEGAERLARGDGWVFSRKGTGHCDAAYAMAGAVHLARTLPAPVGKPRLVVVPG